MPWDEKSRRRYNGKITTHRQVWVEINSTKYVVYVNPDEERYVQESDDDEIVISFQRPRSKFAINLSSMTEEELLAFQQVMKAAIDLALPIAQARDRAAREAYEQGDDTHARIFRRKPEVFTRNRWKKELQDKVKERSTWASTPPPD